MGVRIAWLTEQQGWVGCGGFLHAVLPTHLNSHRKSSGRTLKIVVECAIFANGQNIISSEIRGVLNLVFIVVKESGGEKMVFCSCVQFLKSYASAGILEIHKIWCILLSPKWNKIIIQKYL